MKSILMLASLLSASQAFALDSLCVTKQKNAASFTVAQEVGVPVQGVEVTRFELGHWTEKAGDNTGSDKVSVRVGNRINRGMTIKTYEVSGKQIGSSDDCNILDVVEVQQ